jgi:hypothetical protein
VYWTREVTDAIQGGGAKGLSQYATKCSQELSKLVNLVRGSLTNLERATCGALVVIDVHARYAGHVGSRPRTMLSHGNMFLVAQAIPLTSTACVRF